MKSYLLAEIVDASPMVKIGLRFRRQQIAYFYVKWLNINYPLMEWDSVHSKAFGDQL
jgi:hypothetical protein